MASSFEKSVKGATKYKAAPPKSKYIEHILIATHSGEAGVAEVFRALQHRLRDSTWTIVFKSLITIHLMIREGSPDITLAYLARHKNMLAISSFSDVQTQGRNIRHYTNYLSERARAFKETKCDFVRGATSRLEKLTVEKGLLRETEIVQHQITALLKCDVLDNEPENEITITVFRMLVLDLLAMFHTMNTGLINILGHFFEMSKIDAKRALDIYKSFTIQTDHVVQYLSVARQYEHQTRVEVPKLKHAPVNLGKQLEDYLMDPDFESNRKQYLKEQEIKNNRTANNGVGKNSLTKNGSQPRAITDHSTSESAVKSASSTAKGPDPDLIDFFESIEQNQQQLFTRPGPEQSTTFQIANPPQLQLQPLYHQNGLVPQQMTYQNTNPFPQVFSSAPNVHPGSSHIQHNFTAPQKNGYTNQTSFQSNNLLQIPQNSLTNFTEMSQQKVATPQTCAVQTTNPFRQSTMANTMNYPDTSFSVPSPISTSRNRQSTNPFAKSTTLNQSFPSSLDQSYQIEQQQNIAFAGPTATGNTNPFAKPITTNPGPLPLLTPGQALPLVNTNPFRQSQFVNSNADQGWSNNQKSIGEGLEGLESIPVFPRPVQQVWP